MDLDNLGQSAAELKSAFETLQEQIKNNAKLLAQLTGDAAKGFDPSISKTKKLTEELSKTNKQSLSNYKDRLKLETQLNQVQKELVGLTRQRDILLQRLPLATRAEKLALLSIIDSYNDLIFNSEELISNTRRLSDELKPISENIGTKIFGAISDITSKLPGLNRFSSVFKDAAQAAEKMATQNQITFGNANGITKAQLQSLKTGRGLTAEFAKQLGLVDRNGNTLMGAAAAARARTLGITSAAEKSMNPIMAGLKELGPLLIKAFGPLTLLKEGLNILIGIDKLTGDLAKDFNLTYNQASNLRNELSKSSIDSNNIALNSKTLQETLVAVGKSLGSNAVLNRADLETFTELREMAGYTNEELIGIQKLTLSTGGNLKDNTKQFLGTVAALNAQNKLTINEKQLLKEVANTSAAIKLSVGGTTKGLAESAFQAKQFGINLDQADKIAENLLNFESSITNELSAELITGKNLNLERARLLAINGDIAGASAEILKQVKGSSEFTKMNRIQQEALAKAVGMSREELAASLIEREALSKIGVKDAESAKKQFDILVDKYGYDKAVTMLGDEQYATQLKQQSIQEKMLMTVDKLKEAFVGLIQPILPIINAFSSIVSKILETKVGLLALQTVITGLAVKSIATAISSIFFGSAILGPVGLGIAAAATAGMMAMIVSSQNQIKADDMVSEGGYGNRTLLTPKGSISLNNEDTIIAGTNLGKNNKPSPVVNIDMNPLLDEIKLLRQEQSRYINKPITIENSVDGTRFGTSIAMNTYKIQ